MLQTRPEVGLPQSLSFRQPHFSLPRQAAPTVATLQYCVCCVVHWAQ
jgi:hypothetical protein